MKNRLMNLLLFILISSVAISADKKVTKLPWENGKLMVSENHRYLQHENGTPFFWLGDTGWLLPERLNREESDYYLNECNKRGYNVVQIQTVNAVPSFNSYGQQSMPEGFNFNGIEKKRSLRILGPHGLYYQISRKKWDLYRHDLYLGWIGEFRKNDCIRSKELW